MTRLTMRIEPSDPPDQGPSPPSSPRRRRAFGWAAVAAAAAATAALVVNSTAGGDHAERRDVVARAGNRPALSASADDPRAPGPAPGCMWTSQVDVPVFPAENLGPASTVDSVLVFEACDGAWTGDITWLVPDNNPHPGAAEPTGGDSGLPNPWAAGDAAVARHLGDQPPDTPGPE
ncbi:MAG: hypothetical protein ACLFXM_07340 [Acidimicrobiia bacterium]